MTAATSTSSIAESTANESRKLMAVGDGVGGGIGARILLIGGGAADALGSVGIGEGDQVAGNAALGRVSLDIERRVHVVGVGRDQDRIDGLGIALGEQIAGQVGNRLVLSPLLGLGLMEQIGLKGPARGNDGAENLAGLGHQVDGPHAAAQRDDGQQHHGQQGDGALVGFGERRDGQAQPRADHGREQQDEEVPAEVAVQPADQIDDGQHGAALEDAQAEQHGQLGEDVGKQLERDHALALVDGPLADNVAGGVVAAEPDGGDHHEEMDDGQLLGDFVEVVWRAGGS